MAELHVLTAPSVPRATAARRPLRKPRQSCAEAHRRTAIINRADMLIDDAATVMLRLLYRDPDDAAASAARMLAEKIVKLNEARSMACNVASGADLDDLCRVVELTEDRRAGR